MQNINELIILEESKNKEVSEQKFEYLYLEVEDVPLLIPNSNEEDDDDRGVVIIQL